VHIPTQPASRQQIATVSQDQEILLSMHLYYAQECYAAFMSMSEGSLSTLGQSTNYLDYSCAREIDFAQVAQPATKSLIPVSSSFLVVTLGITSATCPTEPECHTIPFTHHTSKSPSIPPAILPLFSLLYSVAFTRRTAFTGIGRIQTRLLAVEHLVKLVIITHGQTWVKSCTCNVPTYVYMHLGDSTYWWPRNDSCGTHRKPRKAHLAESSSREARSWLSSDVPMGRDFDRCTDSCIQDV